MPPSRRRGRPRSRMSTPLSRTSSSATQPNGTNKLLSLHALSKRYPNLQQPLKRTHWEGCRCAGTCTPTTCTCLQDGAPCRQSCKCGPSCEHQFPPCTCKTNGGACGEKCPCYLAHHQCSTACACPDDKCDDENNLPEVEVKDSQIPSAGLGLFAKQDIEKRRLIGWLEGQVEPHPKEPDFDCFDIAKDHSLRCSKEGAYFTNEMLFKEANAEFRYMEGKRRREIVIRAKRDIKAGEEITSQYTDRKQPPCFPPEDFQTGSYVLVKGEGEDDPWVAQIVSMGAGKKKMTVQWLLRKQDLGIIPPPLRKSIRLDKGELIMTEGWRDILDWETMIRVIYVREERPEDDELGSNVWWWTRCYDAKKKKLK
ncbi:hypothetical protein BU26DRAFT_521222 [Trematosphaeria pertusa]|uniref:SET domain-containing protein n=1 Tax=Trematosphaeria pertusa TaxID=390896 RepID=A0A6A6IA52_9PLEO|nr:uncharacterized protein BU26DRAFT_521222 [Trematosphaeria pertusa]KAF2246802.1 hypothetical protein BU26DRAFT_521222 [Trematosphaeria pertusa]